MSDTPSLESRRKALKCLAYGGAGTLFTLAGGILTPIELALAASYPKAPALGRPLFVQISDTHIGFNKEANPDVNGTLTRTIELVNAMPEQPELIIHTGDITHLSRPAEFDLAQQMLGQLRTTELHTVPGEHDTSDATVTEYFNRFGKASDNKGYYSFDHAGVHFIALINVLQFKAGGLGTLGDEQLAWVAADLKARSSSTPIVVFAHMPLWTIYEPWGWGTGDADQLCHAAPVRIGHHAQWPHPPDRAEGGRQHHLSLRALDCLSAAGRRGGARPLAAQGARRAAAAHAGGHERLGGQALSSVRAPRQYIDLRGVVT